MLIGRHPPAPAQGGRRSQDTERRGRRVPHGCLRLRRARRTHRRPSRSRGRSIPQRMTRLIGGPRPRGMSRACLAVRPSVDVASGRAVRTLHIRVKTRASGPPYAVRPPHPGPHLPPGPAADGRSEGARPGTGPPGGLRLGRAGAPDRPPAERPDLDTGLSAARRAAASGSACAQTTVAGRDDGRYVTPSTASTHARSSGRLYQAGRRATIHSRRY